MARWWIGSKVLMAVALVAAGILGGCRSSEPDDKPSEELRFELGDGTSAFRDLGKRAASSLE